MLTAQKILAGIIILILFSVIFAPLLAPFDPYEMNLEKLRMPPSLEHPLGTDQKGRDILSRLLYGGRTSLMVAMVAAFISFILGFIMGMLSGFIGGWFDVALMAIVDLLLAFPSLLLAIAISVILPQNVYTVIIALSLVGWAPFARLIRGYVLTIKDAYFIQAARAIGAGEMRIFFRHLMPQCFYLGTVYMSMKIGGFILSESALSFLGLGAQPPVPTWGGMISSSRAYMLSDPWMVIFPGLAIAITALSFNLLGDSLQKKKVGH
ncbi:MAG: ABC transporter permease [Thermodesulfovibrionales bacterium]|nr:ABC transporter permease [Thermodesulfovibrionales bacterium]